MKLAALVVTIGLMLANPGACAPETPPAPPKPRVVTFYVEAYGGDGPIARFVTIGVSGVLASGKLSNILDPTTGQLVPSPIVRVAKTPIRFDLTMLPGIVAASISVRGNARKGERLTCFIEYNGQRGWDSSSPTQTKASGVVSTSCEYLGG